MATVVERVTFFRDDDVCFPFGGKPSFWIPPEDGTYGSTVDIDLFPCYSHTKDVLFNTINEVEAKFPIRWMPKYYILPYDTTAHTNGHASPDYVYNGKNNNDAPEFRCHIVLAGKTIPLHPFMTRYLVAHEYGHCVDYWLHYCLGFRDGIPSEFDKDYAKMRGIEACTDYGARKWHKNIGEIIANDFRIAVCNIEPEFWPHLVEHPLKVPAVLQFWKDAQEKYSFKEPSV